MVATTGSDDKAQVLAEFLEAEGTTLICVGADEVVTSAEGPGLELMGLVGAVGRPLAALFAGDPEALDRWRRCLAGAPLRSESVLGRASWLQMFRPRRAADGAIVGAAMLALEVTRDLTTLRQAQLLRELVNNVPTNVFAVDARGTCLLSEGGLLGQIGLSPGESVGVDIFAAYSSVPGITEAIRAALRGASSVVEYQFGDQLYSQQSLPRRDRSGAVIGAYCIAANITEQRRNEELLREQMRVIQDQREAIVRLSSPIIEVGHDSLAVPLVGQVDNHRAATIMHGLLDAIVHKRARFAILDLTGVDTVDPDSAEQLVRIVHSVRMLGAQAIVTGIRPAIAQTMADLGVDLTRLHTLRSLQDALAYCSRASA